MEIAVMQNKWIVFVCLMMALLASFLTVKWGFVFPLLLSGVSISIIYFLFLVKQPAIGLYTTLVFCFLMPMLGRELSGIPFGIGVEVLLLSTWLALFFKNQTFEWGNLRNDLMGITLAWFVISVLEVANPAGASVMGWLQELRNAALHGMLIIPIALITLNDKKSIDRVLFAIISVSILAALNGVRQLRYLTPGEQVFLKEMATTHLIWGKLRVFSFYTDAGQFGASQAHMALIALLLAFGPLKWWSRVLLIVATLVLLWGMLISGTRGAFFVLVFGGFFALILFKNFKVLLGGVLLMGLTVGFLKYTSIGSNNYQIARLRTALDPQDASLNLRFINQKKLADYLQTRPFGGGLGVLGVWGHEYNSDKYLSSIEPDSYWVKVWAMYGIVGFVLWFGMMMYLFGKCGGIIWRIRDPGLKIKLIALASGAFGVFIASYGNEVMNRVPSSIVLYVSWALIYLGPSYDKKQNELDNDLNVI